MMQTLLPKPNQTNEDQTLANKNLSTMKQPIKKARHVVVSVVFLTNSHMIRLVRNHREMEAMSNTTQTLSLAKQKEIAFSDKTCC